MNLSPINKQILATQEFRAIPSLERLAQYKILSEKSYDAIVEDHPVKKTALQRAVKATQEGREVGKNGRPSALHDNEQNILADRVKALVDLKEEIDMKMAMSMVSRQIPW